METKELKKRDKIYLVKEWEALEGGGFETILGAWKDKSSAEIYAASQNAGRYTSWSVEEVEVMDSLPNVSAHPIRPTQRTSESCITFPSPVNLRLTSAVGFVVLRLVRPF